MMSMGGAMAGDTPPAPAAKTTFEKTPPPPGLPIDESIMFLQVSCLLFGFYKIYTSILKKKGSV